MRKVLITGGSGFIGSHLCSQLVEKGWDVTAFSRSAKFAFSTTSTEDSRRLVNTVTGDILDASLVNSLVSTTDVLIHKAAAVGVAESGNQVKHFVDTNVTGTANLVDALKNGRHTVRKVILGSSISVYGEGNYFCGNCGTVRPDFRLSQQKIEELADWNPRCPLCVSHLEPDWTPESAERKGESIYAITKKTQEDLLVSTCRTLGIPCTVLRYCTVYGPGQSARNPYSRIVKMMMNGHAPVINEDGMQSRDFIFVSDVVAANMMALSDSQSGISYYNVGSALQVPLISFVLKLRDAIARLHSREIATPVITNKLLPGEIRHCQADCSNIKAKLGFQAQIALDDGVEQFLKWFVSEGSLNLV